MKNTLQIFTAVILLLACNDKKKTGSADISPLQPQKETSPAGKAETKSTSFTVDGKTYTGEMTTQYFGDKETKPFSIICQQDDPLATLQIVFANEKDGATDQSFSTASSYFNLKPGEVHVSLSGSAIGQIEFVSSINAPGEVTVSNRKVVIKDLKLSDHQSHEKTVNASIPF